MKTFKQLINEVFEREAEGNAFSQIKMNKKDNSLSIDKTPKQTKKEVQVKNKDIEDSSLKKQIAGLSMEAAGHLIGSCFKFFNSNDFTFNFNKIHVTLRKDKFEVTNLTERVNGSGMPQKDIVITREDINDILQIQNPADAIEIIRSGGITSKDSSVKSSYNFKTTEIKDATYPVDSEMVATRGEKKEVYDNNQINQLNLKVTHGSQRGGSNVKEEKRQYTKPLHNDYVINNKAKLCVKIKGIDAYIFVIPIAERSNVVRAKRMRTAIESSEADKWAGIVVYSKETEYNPDLFADRTFLIYLADSLANPKLKA